MRPHPSLHNTKIRVPDPSISKAVQERLFLLGYRWSSNGNHVTDTNCKFLFLKPSGSITRAERDAEFFDMHDHKEISIPELFAIPLNSPDELITVTTEDGGKLTRTREQWPDVLDQLRKEYSGLGTFIISIEEALIE